MELVNIFYCLRVQTPLFVTFYDLQGYGGGIQFRLHTPLNLILQHLSDLYRYLIT
jgi:hypothetical protein